MLWLNILDNETVLLIAETLFIIVGSMLLGILLSYFYWGGSRSAAREAAAALEQERERTEDIKLQIRELQDTRSALQSEIIDLRLKNDQQAKAIFDHQQYIFSIEADHQQQKSISDALQSAVDSYKQRLQIIEGELEKARDQQPKPRKPEAAVPMRVNYEHVSSLLGRQVTENDLTLITGIGPKTAALLQENGIRTWAELGETPIGDLRRILEAAGGIYKSQDPGQWARQSRMAARGEWRKLRILQENLRKSE